MILKPFNQSLLLETYNPRRYANFAAMEGLRSMIVESEEDCIRHKKTIFLSHSNKDKDLALAFVEMMRRKGISVYVDLYDSTLVLPPSSKTAEQLQSRIKGCSDFLLLATANSVHKSAWCPWEVGYAGGVGTQIGIIVTEDAGTTYGAEYLDMYPSADFYDNRYCTQKLAYMSCKKGVGALWNAEFKAWIA